MSSQRNPKKENGRSTTVCTFQAGVSIQFLRFLEVSKNCTINLRIFPQTLHTPQSMAALQDLNTRY